MLSFFSAKVVKGIKHKALYSYQGSPPAPSGKSVLTFKEGKLTIIDENELLAESKNY